MRQRGGRSQELRLAKAIPRAEVNENERRSSSVWTSSPVASALWTSVLAPCLMDGALWSEVMSLIRIDIERDVNETRE